MNKILLFPLLVITAHLSDANPNGYTDPFGRSDTSTVNYAFWDIFDQTQVGETNTYTFHGIADTGSNLTGLNLTQNNAHILGSQGSGLLDDGDVYYSSTFAQSWTLTAIATIDIATISFQIKTANVNESVINQIFTPTLNGVGAEYYAHTELDEKIFNFNAYVIEYRWTGLNIAAGTPLEISFSMAGGSSGDFTRKPVDFVALDVTSVPEPATWTLIGIGLSTAGFHLRRKIFLKK